jgi:predicted house-cleaning noncanonical NTP pyrophosphatase (MazG superfamily)
MKNRQRRKKTSRSVPARSELLPSQPITLLLPDGLRFLSAPEVTVDAVGEKAFGLSALPPGWTQPFFVVASSCNFSTSPDMSAIGRHLRSSLREAIEQLGAGNNELLIVRSSGVRETLKSRGSLDSETCRIDQLPAVLREMQKVHGGDPGAKVHWVVQRKVEAHEQGHLSNERRLREEPRDWIAQIEKNDPGGATSLLEPLAVREWREGRFQLVDRLICRYSSDILNTLKIAAHWGMQFSKRWHFEWVWDGATLSLVQVDSEEASAGVDPYSLVAESVVGKPPKRLKVFREANDRDFERFAKLKNARLYRDLGYSMPPFFVLEDSKSFSQILNGHPSRELLSDLEKLCERPLIIRVDGLSIPKDKREMLPRSDELRSGKAAVSWLTDAFAKNVIANNLASCKLCLIAHHFVPATAAAWARAEPDNRWVRIESLWGVPEGLYWYTHDTFEVDTIASAAVDFTHVDRRSFVTRERRRFKDLFVAPGNDGKWVTHHAKKPFDWRRSISKDSWLQEIAETTRRVAVKDARPTSVMWFVDVHVDASSHAVLPWFHSESQPASGYRAAPRRKVSSHRDFTVRSREDWNRLKSLAELKRIDRVRIEPTDPDLIRSQEFSQEIADFAGEHGVVIELAGGVLSHIYYVLTNSGCNIECIDLYGADEEEFTFNKVVRDQIPSQIQQKGERVELRQLKGQALVSALKKKLLEESYEVLDARSKDDARAEIADVLEVVDALTRAEGFSLEEIASERARKAKKRGAFNEGYMLVRTLTPHTLPVTDLTLQHDDEKPTESPGEIPKVVTAAVPSSKLTVKPDMRSVEGGFEKLLSFATELTELESVRGSMQFEVPPSAQAKAELSIEIELRRVKGELRGIVRIRSAPSQLLFEFDLLTPAGSRK